MNKSGALSLAFGEDIEGKGGFIWTRARRRGSLDAGGEKGEREAARSDSPRGAEIVEILQFEQLKMRYKGMDKVIIRQERGYLDVWEVAGEEGEGLEKTTRASFRL